MMKKGFMAVAMVCMLSAASVMGVHAEEAQTETADEEMSVPVSALEWDENLQQMFVDEGFGSLDQGALGNAISLLSELSGGNKLVGIISHVEDLKTNIPRKIVVSKGKAGSRVDMEL